MSRIANQDPEQEDFTHEAILDRILDRTQEDGEEA